MSWYKLSATLLKVLCDFYLIVKMRSPLAKSGTYSASFSITIVSPFDMPFSMSIYTCLLSLMTLLALQCGHLAAMDLPLPPHSGHYVCIYIYIPNPIVTICITTPCPLHFLQVFNLPSFAPVPLHYEQ